MKKKFLILLLTLTMILSSSPYVAKAADTDDTDSSNKTDTIDGRTYFYDQFDNSAYRTVYKQINDAAQKFNESTSMLLIRTADITQHLHCRSATKTGKLSATMEWIRSSTLCSPIILSISGCPTAISASRNPRENSDIQLSPSSAIHCMPTEIHVPYTRTTLT